MSKIDIRLLYQKDSGLSLVEINRIADNPEFDNSYEGADHQDYLHWLEEQLEAALSVGDRLLQSHNALLENEKSK